MAKNALQMALEAIGKLQTSGQTDAQVKGVGKPSGLTPRADRLYFRKPIRRLSTKGTIPKNGFNGKDSKT